MSRERVYIAIDLKSFYASVECRERGLDPMTTNLVVADKSRTDKTICLAVSPALKSIGVPGRPRLFQVVQIVRQENARRRKLAPEREFQGYSTDAKELQENPALELDYLVAPPRMALYLEYSSRIYDIYLNYVSAEDIHVYSIDEVFMDVTEYLHVYNKTPKELTTDILRDVLEQTGITATAGIGTNLYLAKIAMDIVAKRMQPDEHGARIAELDEKSYRQQLWTHEPLTDFWRVGRGYERKLHDNGLYTMGDIARCSIGREEDHFNEELLYKLFGINAELLIDHAWGWEPCTMREIKSYRPTNNSTGAGQVLHCPYSFEKAKLITREMTDLLVLDLVDKKLVTDQMVLTIGYDRENIDNPEIRKKYKGEITTDHYGRKVPKHAHGTISLGRQTSSGKIIMEAVMNLYDQIVDKNLLVRRVNVVANHIVPEDKIEKKETYEQMDLFTDYEELRRKQEKEEAELEKEKKIQQALLEIKKRYGKNAVLKGMNLEEGATAMDRNRQIGGHKA